MYAHAGMATIMSKPIIIYAQNFTHAFEPILYSKLCFQNHSRTNCFISVSWLLYQSKFLLIN